MVSTPFRNYAKSFPSPPCICLWFCARLMDDAVITTELTLLPIFAGHLSLLGQQLQQAAGNVALICPLWYGPLQDVGSIPAGHWMIAVFSLSMTKSAQIPLALRPVMLVETATTFLLSASFWFPGAGYAPSVEMITVSSCVSASARSVRHFPA